MGYGCQLHIFQEKNIEAGTMSRIFRNATEWKLFDMVTQKLGRPSTVMSGSCSNKQLDKYAS